MEELKPLKSYLLTHMIDYIPKSTITRYIISKETGNVTISAYDKGEILKAKVLAFDKLIHIIDGAAEVIIDDKTTHLKAGQIMLIPAHSPNTIRANQRFKMLSTVIKSGYEEVNI
ncbi:MAG: cupin domain-containing protein [Cyclobacteriaceae bacterium]